MRLFLLPDLPHTRLLSLPKPRLTALALLLTTALAGCGDGTEGAAEGELSRVTIATGPAGTLYNQIGVAMTTVIQRELGMPSTARPHTGSSVYLPQVHRGELPFAINLSVDLQSAYDGAQPYGQAMHNLRAGMLITRAPFQYFVRGDSGIDDLADLRGREVVTSFRSLATFDRVNAAVLATADVTFDQLEPVVVAGVPDAIRALVESRADGAGTVLGIPALREADATLSGGIRVLGLGSNEAALQAVPGLSPTTLEPGPAFVGIDEPTRVAQFDVYLNTGTHLSADQVYQVVRTVHRNWGRLQQEQPALRRTADDQMVPQTLIVPFHEGAIRYFREAGLWTEEHDQQQRALLGQQQEGDQS